MDLGENGDAAAGHAVDLGLQRDDGHDHGHDQVAEEADHRPGPQPVGVVGCLSEGDGRVLRTGLRAGRAETRRGGPRENDGTRDRRQPEGGDGDVGAEALLRAAGQAVGEQGPRDRPDHTGEEHEPGVPGGGAR